MPGPIGAVGNTPILPCQVYTNTVASPAAFVATGSWIAVTGLYVKTDGTSTLIALADGSGSTAHWLHTMRAAGQFWLPFKHPIVMNGGQISVIGGTANRYNVVYRLL